MKEKELLELMEDMSLEEKVGQLVQLSNELYESEAVLTGPAKKLDIGEKEIYEAGSVLSVFEPTKIKEIQTRYMEKQPHHIPLLFMADIINGYKTIFPIPLAQGCSFDPDEVQECAQISARESAIAGLHVTFSPMVDLVRDARWGRDMESIGEDPYLNCCMAKAMVQGYQGGDVSQKGKIAACVKHFAAYGMPTGAREYNNVELSERTLREFYLPAYKAGIDAGAELVMTSFNTLDHVPATGNRYLMQDILRKEMGFKGTLISDWAAIEELIIHGIAEDKEEAAKLAMEAGVDIDMATNVYVKNLPKLVEQGIISQKQIDESVLRILKLKNKLGLFENPYKDLDVEESKNIILCAEHRDKARKAAANTLVLVKNDHMLPLKKEEEKVAFIGPYIESRHLYGMWSILGDDADTVSIKEGIMKKVSPDCASFCEGAYLLEKGNKIAGFHETAFCKCDRTEEALLEEAIEYASVAEKVVLALGEHAYQSGEGGSRAEIKIPDCQMNLLREVAKVNDNIIVVLFHGRPLELREIETHAKAILLAWFPGSEGGNAVADVLYGDVNPSAKLSMSFPYSVGQIPVFYNQFTTGRPFNGERDNRFQSMYQDIPNEPLYPFGYGLSYSKFTYSAVKLSASEIFKGETVTVSVTVKNDSDIAGQEIVQLYIRDVCGSTVRPVRELKGFQKISLDPMERKEVIFEVEEEMLKFYDINMNYVCESGEFQVFVGGDSRTDNMAAFQILKK